MRKLKNFSRAIIAIAMMLITAFDSLAHDFEVDGIYYNITNSTDNTVAVTFSGSSVSEVANEYSGDVTIPGSVVYNDVLYTISSIGSEAFRGCSSLTSVTIGNSVTSIGYGAFYNCTGLTSVTIPNSVTSIRAFAFADCSSLTSVTIPNSVTSIGGYAFYGCSGLTSVTIPNSVTSIGKGAFYNCTGLTSVTIPNSVTSIGSEAFRGCSSLTSVTIPNSVTSIGGYAFYGCSGLTSVTIPNSVTSIGGYAFYGCSGLTSVTIPNSVTSIGKGAFYNCTGLTSIVVEGGNTNYDSRDNCNAIIETATNTLISGCKNTIIPNSVTSIGDCAFSYCSGLTSVTIPNSVTSIGYGAFLGCSGLTSVTIPNSVTSIGKGAFLGCSGLTSVTIPNSVTSIGSEAFRGCSSLISVTIGNSVTSIGDYAFQGCSSLTSVTIPNSVTSIGGSAFSGCSGLTSIVVEGGNTNYDSRDNCNAIIETATNTLISGCKNTIIPNSVTSIGVSAFVGCTGLTSVTIPNSVTSIGDYAFCGCSGLTSIVVEGGNTNYDSRDNCNAIIETATNTLISGCKNTIIPNSVTSIGDYAFCGCSGLTYVTIPNSVTSIGGAAFFDCTGLTSVTIPNSVTSIGYSAFLNCSGLTKVTSLNPEPPTCGSGGFSGVANCTLEVPAGAKEAYGSAYCWSDFGNIVEIATVEVSTQENKATFEIPTTQGAVSYIVNVYSDEAMTQLVATANYDASGSVIPMSTSLELSIDGFADGSYYYDVIAKSESGETLSNYTGSFAIDTTGIEGLTSDETTVTEVARYDIHGRLLSAPTKGINIVKYSDGTVKKIIHN